MVHGLSLSTFSKDEGNKEIERKFHILYINSTLTKTIKDLAK